MTYDDTNEELRIRQRSILQALYIAEMTVALQFLMLAAVLSDVFSPLVFLLSEAAFVAVAVFHATSMAEDNIARRIMKWRADSPNDVPPPIDYETLKESANTPRRTTDGGEE